MADILACSFGKAKTLFFWEGGVQEASYSKPKKLFYILPKLGKVETTSVLFSKESHEYFRLQLRGFQ